MTIIHISGPSGAGKTTIGNKLKDKFGAKIVVKDIDDLRTEFIKEFYGEKKWNVINKNAYQKYINSYISSIKKPLIFVGLNNMPWWHKDLYYNMHAEHCYYIDLDDKTIIKQKCVRLLNDIQNDDNAMRDIKENNKIFIRNFTEAINVECNLDMLEKMSAKWKKDYKIMSREDIYKEVVKLLKTL